MLSNRQSCLSIENDSSDEENFADKNVKKYVVEAVDS